jgi:hypothetical protein
MNNQLQNLLNNLYNQSQDIKKEAEELLKNNSISKILSKYGEIKFTGSYELDLMFKKDIDISLINNKLTVPEFTQLGKELIDQLKTPSVYYRNTRINPIEKRPENSLYWGVQIDEWFLDIWAMSKNVYLKSEYYINEIKAKLNQENRNIILSLKYEYLKSKRYSKQFGSRELYEAVLNHDVKTSKEFDKYLSEKSFKNEYR